MGPEKAILPRKRQQFIKRAARNTNHSQTVSRLCNKSKLKKGADRTPIDVMQRVEKYLILGYYWRDVRAASIT